MTIDSIDVTEALLTGLIPNTMYKLRLVAVNQAGRSSPSNEVDFQTAIGGKPCLVMLQNAWVAGRHQKPGGCRLSYDTVWEVGV